MIEKKAQEALQENNRGMMSWDLATDVDYTNNWSLLKAMKETIASNK